MRSGESKKGYASLPSPLAFGSSTGDSTDPSGKLKSRKPGSVLLRVQHKWRMVESGHSVKQANQTTPYRSLVSLHLMEQGQGQGMRSNHDPGRSTLSPGIEFYRGGFEI